MPGEFGIQPMKPEDAKASLKDTEENQRRGANVAASVIIGGGTATGLAALEHWLTGQALEAAATKAIEDGKTDAEIKEILDNTLLLSAGLKLGGGATVTGLTAAFIRNPFAAWFGFGAGFGTMASGGIDLVEWGKRQSTED